MAFSMNAMSGAFSSSSSNVALREGPALAEISPDSIGFKGLNGDRKARVLDQPWPADNLPPSYASLLSIASAHGLYAAGGPDGVAVGKTQDARDRIYDKDGDLRCAPLAVIACSRPVSVTFAADESCLVVATQDAAEIHAYQSTALSAKNTIPALKLSTNAPIRYIVANPDPASAHYFALVNTNGQLLIADLRANKLVQGNNGPVLSDNVTCITWSNKGKQLMAGKADGTAVQLKQDGSIVAALPKPDSVPANCHLAQIVWPENDAFFFIYTPTTANDVADVVSEYYLVRADKTRTNLELSKSESDPLFAMVDRLPAHFFISRLRSYPPHLEETMFLTSTVSPDVRIITKASQPLSPGDNVEQRGTYTFTQPNNDQRWAALPRSEDGESDTTAIGMAIDLSDELWILKPIPTEEELENSVVPLPELVALNHEGMLVYWAFLYDDGIKTKKLYPGFEDVQKLKQGVTLGQSATNASASNLPQSNQPVVSSPAATSSATMAQQNKPAESPAFGVGPGFGKSTPIGEEKKSSWTNTGFGTGSTSQTAAFGQPATFGGTSTLSQATKPAFGAAGFGQTGFGSKPAFGQASSFANSSAQSSPFGSKTASGPSGFAASPGTSSSGFGSFASQGGFGTAKKEGNQESSFSSFGKGGGFGTTTTSSPFTTNTQTKSTSSSIFGQATPIGNANTTSASPFGQSKPFKLQSTFEKDETSNKVGEDDDSGSFSFGGGLRNMAGQSSQPLQSPSKEEDMEEDDGSATEVETIKKPQETPPSTIAQSKPSTTPHVSSLFGTTQQSTTPLTQPQVQLNAGWGFSNVTSTTPKDTPAPSKSIFGTQPTSSDTPAAVQKSEPNRPFSFTNLSNQSSKIEKVKSLSSDDDGESQKEPEAPLPPDPFSKPGYQAGDTSASSLASKLSREADEAPLPPDFLSTSKNTSQSLKTQDSSVPSELLSDSEGSGEDVTGDVSPVEDRHSDDGEHDERVETSPESSFGRGTDHSPRDSPIGGAFTNVKVDQANQQPRPLFGEFGGTQGPVFAPPKPQQSPRSPSPMRKPPRQGMLSRSPERSFSAPAQPRSLIAQRKFEHQQSPFAAQAAQLEQQEAHKERLRREAERQAQQEAEAAQLQPLEDDEDALLREELAKPTQPSENLDPFIAIQPGKALQELDTGRTDVPSQIEILYQDINSMIVTLGINAKSLSAYLMYQTDQDPSESWPDLLKSDTPTDALNDEWFLADIERLPEGQQTISTMLKGLEVQDVIQKLEDCENLLTGEIGDLRSRITALRRSTQSRLQPENHQHAPLSAEQASIQQDLRKASTSALSGLTKVEDELSILRAKLADLAPSRGKSDTDNAFGLMSSAQKRPSVEAVMNTVTKMTAMAEKRSADVDVLEAQMKKLNMSLTDINEQPKTPERRASRRGPATPGSAASSIYHTPETQGSRSTRNTPAKGDQIVVSTVDRQKWQAKARKKAQVSDMLKDILREKHSRIKTNA